MAFGKAFHTISQQRLIFTNTYWSLDRFYQSVVLSKGSCFFPWPLACGLYGVCCCQSIPSTLLTCWVSSAVKCGPLSVDLTEGTPNLSIISFNNTLDTSLALLVLCGNAPGHLEKVSVSTNRHLKPPFLESLKKSICPCFPGTFPFPIVPVWGLIPVWGLLLGLSDNGIKIRPYPFST